MLIALHVGRPNAPGACAFCAKPFHGGEAAVQIWRSTSGQYFCSEFCADDAEEVCFNGRRKITAIQSTRNT